MENLEIVSERGLIFRKTVHLAIKILSLGPKSKSLTLLSLQQRPEPLTSLFVTEGIFNLTKNIEFNFIGKES